VVSTQEDLAMVLSLDEAIDKLNAENARYGSILEMRVCGAMTQPEIARVLGVSLATVEKDWKYIKPRALSLLGEVA